VVPWLPGFLSLRGFQRCQRCPGVLVDRGCRVVLGFLGHWVWIWLGFPPRRVVPRLLGFRRVPGVPGVLGFPVVRCFPVYPAVPACPVVLVVPGVPMVRVVLVGRVGKEGR
jgi:hypothetical protein